MEKQQVQIQSIIINNRNDNSNNNSTVNSSKYILSSFLINITNSLLSCCYTHHPPLSLSLSLSLIFFFVNVIVSWSFVVFLFYCSLQFDCILLYVLAGATKVTERMVAKKSLERMTRILGHFSALLVKDYLATTRNQFLNWQSIRGCDIGIISFTSETHQFQTNRSVLNKRVLISCHTFHF